LITGSIKIALVLMWNIDHRLHCTLVALTLIGLSYASRLIMQQALEH